MNRQLYLFLFLFLPWGIPAQQTDSLIRDTTYFQQQSKVYQQWLDFSGIGSMIKVRQVQVITSRNILSLYLEFTRPGTDYAVNVWDRLEENFADLGALSLEQTLFTKMVEVMQIDAGQALIQVYDTYDLTKEPTFFQAIYLQEGEIRIEGFGPKSTVKPIYISPIDFSDVTAMDRQQIQKIYSRDFLFREILTFSNNHFEEKSCNPEKLQLKVIADQSLLWFEIEGLCKTVFENQSNHYFCEKLISLGLGSCNTIKREKLSFKFSFSEMDSGIHLSCTVDGWYSKQSIIFGRGDYLLMDDQFFEPFDTYAEKYMAILKNHLLKPRP